MNAKRRPGDEETNAIFGGKGGCIVPRSKKKPKALVEIKLHL